MYNRKAKIVTILKQSKTVEEFVNKVIDAFGDDADQSLNPIRIDITDLFFNSKTIGDLVDELNNLKSKYKQPVGLFKLDIVVREELVSRGNTPHYWLRPIRISCYNGVIRLDKNFIISYKTINNTIKKDEDGLYSTDLFKKHKINYVLTKSKTLDSFIKQLNKLPRDGEIEMKSKILTKNKKGEYKYKWVDTPKKYLKAEVSEDTCDIRSICESYTSNLETRIRKIQDKVIPKQ